MIRRLSPLQVLTLLATAVLAVSTPATTARDDSFVVQRPISEFIEAQGTFCLDDGMGGCSLLAPPVENFLAWSSPRQNRAASVDYAGLANRAIVEAGGASLGTVTEGSVLERRLADGRAEITVTLHTRKALTWVIEGDGEGNFDFGAGPLLFGHRVPEVLGGARPVLGDSVLEVVFTNPAPGAPLPDLEQVLFAPARGQEVRFISFFASVSNPRSEATGAPDGNSGRMEVTRSGLLMDRSMGAPSRSFQAERIDLDSVAAAQPACRGNRACDDGNPCTFGDRCKAGVCLGTSYLCDDGNPCTTDTCNGTGGCNFTNNTLPCSDSNACTSNDTCSAGSCVSGAPVVCNDNNVCTTDSCDPASGRCVSTSNTGPCDDGNVCSTNDACSQGFCFGTPASGNACDDLNACTTNDVCDNGSCAGTPIPDCNPCVGLCEGDFCPQHYECVGFCCMSHCFDSVQNADETDVDCGGTLCYGMCMSGQHCNQADDCITASCVDGICQ